METNYIALAIPFFFLLIGVELVIARFQRRHLYRLSDSVNDLSCGIIQQLVGVFAKVVILGLYIWIYDHYRFFTLEATSIWTWIACFLLIDFAYYWFHRLSHEINFLWAAHVVHHQSEEYNLAVALRQSALQGFFSTPFYWPLALLGFDPITFATLSAFNTLYQFWIHTRTVGRLGFLEQILMTPSHHRVHHGRNPQYIDRNHGATFIFWDKLFGTFEAEDEEVVYGITKPLASWNPIWANLHYWIELWDSARRTRGLRNKLAVFLKPPGWFPDDLGGFQPAPEIGENPVKFDVPFPALLGWYAVSQFSLIVALTTVFIFQARQLSLPLQLLATGAVVWTLIDLGGLFEGHRWAFAAEALRLVLFPLAALPFTAAGAPFWLVWLLAANALSGLLLPRLRGFFASGGRTPEPIPAT